MNIKQFCIYNIHFIFFIRDNVEEETAESRHAKKTLLKTLKKAKEASAQAAVPVQPIEEKKPEPTSYFEKLKLKKLQENDVKMEFPELAPTSNENGKIATQSAWASNVEEIELENDENTNENEVSNNKPIKKTNKFAGKKKHRMIKV